MTDSRTMIVIGGGHNGLICAAYLARAGHDVQVLEANEAVGGGASTHAIAAGYRVSGLAHVLHALSPKVCRDLDLATAGLMVGEPIDTISLGRDGRHLTLGASELSGIDLSQTDIDAYREFKKEFRNYAGALESLMMNKPPRLKNMDRRDKITLASLGWKLRFGLGADPMAEFLRVGGINIHDVLNEAFVDPRIKGALAVDAVLGHHMGPRTPGTVLTYLHKLRGEIYGSQTLPPGGMGQVATALSEAVTQAGASIRTGARVTQVIVSDGRVTGVELQSGERISADVVISNADAKTTFLDLVGTAELDAMFAHRIAKTRTAGNVAKLHFALSGLPEVPGLSREQLGQRLIIAPDLRYVEHAFNHAKYGEYSENPVLEITLPSISDPSLAPEGQHVMSISATFAPHTLKKGWEDSREDFKNRVCAVIEQYAPGFSTLIVARELLTPADIETQYNVAGGHWHHGELTIDQSFMMRPVHGTAQYSTPVEGLFLCGAATHPGGGINGVPGHNAAQRILSMKGGKSS